MTQLLPNKTVCREVRERIDELLREINLVSVRARKHTEALNFGLALREFDDVQKYTDEIASIVSKMARREMFGEEDRDCY